MTVDTALIYGLALGEGDAYAARFAAILNDAPATADDADDEAPLGDLDF